MLGKPLTSYLLIYSTEIQACIHVANIFLKVLKVIEPNYYLECLHF